MVALRVNYSTNGGVDVAVTDPSRATVSGVMLATPFRLNVNENPHQVLDVSLMSVARNFDMEGVQIPLQKSSAIHSEGPQFNPGWKQSFFLCDFLISSMTKSFL